MVKPSILFPLIALTLTTLATAKAEQFNCSLEINDYSRKSISYSSEDKLLKAESFDTSGNLLQTQTLAEGPSIARQTNDGDPLFIFSKNEKEILRLQKNSSRYSNSSLQFKGEEYSCTVDLLLQPTPKSREELCKMSENLGSFLNLLKAPENRLTFRNRGGLIGGGVCWWHTRWERNAAYLAVYRPDLPQPSMEEVLAIIAAIRAGNQIVEIPGFENLRAFSRTYGDYIQKSLEEWQISEGVFGGGWSNGLASDVADPAALQQTMNQTYELVTQQNRVVMQTLKFPGIQAHLWAVIGMKKTANGYSLQVTDSNYPGQVRSHDYIVGMSQMTYPGGRMAPYLTNDNLQEEERIIQTLQQACSANQ